MDTRVKPNTLARYAASLGAGMTLALLACLVAVAPVSAKQATIRPVADGSVLDAGSDGVGDVTIDGVNSVIVGFNAHFGAGEYRGVYEFDLRGASCASPATAVLWLDWAGTSFEPPDPALTLYGGAGNGVLDAQDFGAGALVTGFAAWDVVGRGGAFFNVVDVSAVVNGALDADARYVRFVLRPNVASAVGRSAWLYSSNEITDTFGVQPTVLELECVEPSAAEKLEALRESVSALGRVTANLTARLGHASEALRAGETRRACAELGAFAQVLRGVNAKWIPAALAREWLDEVVRIKAAIPC
jgi:hypothetical protein